MIETIAGLIDLALFISMFVLVYKNNRRIQEIQTQYTELDKKLTKLTKDTKKNHEELLNSFDDKSITIAEGVTDIIETLEDFEVPYEDVGKVIDEKNLPNYKITFSEGYVILLSYDFQTVTLITPDDTSKYSNWTEFKDTLINVLSLIKCPDQENTDGQTEEPKDAPEEPGEDTTET
jgi:uncharacterized protein (DUF342 family)